MLLQAEAFWALAQALAQAQVMETELELHVDFHHRKPDTRFSYQKPLSHTSYKVEYPL